MWRPADELRAASQVEGANWSAGCDGVVMSPQLVGCGRAAPTTCNLHALLPWPKRPAEETIARQANKLARYNAIRRMTLHAHLDIWQCEKIKLKSMHQVGDRYATVLVCAHLGLWPNQTGIIQSSFSLRLRPDLFDPEQVDWSPR